MNRSELIKKLADKFRDIDTKDTDLAVRLIFDAMIASLAQGRRIEIRNFGSLQCRIRSTTTYRNPRTGDTVFKEPVRFIRFKAGKDLQKQLFDDVQSEFAQSEQVIN